MGSLFYRCVPACDIYTSQIDCSTFGANACAWNPVTGKCNVACGLIGRNYSGRNYSKDDVIFYPFVVLAGISDPFVVIAGGCEIHPVFGIGSCETSATHPSDCRIKCSEANSSPATCDDTAYFNSSGCRYYNTTNECGRDCSAYNIGSSASTAQAEGCPSGRCSGFNSKCYLPCSTSANATSCTARENECDWFASKCDSPCESYSAIKCPPGRCAVTDSRCYTNCSRVTAEGNCTSLKECVWTSYQQCKPSCSKFRASSSCLSEDHCLWNETWNEKREYCRLGCGGFANETSCDAASSSVTSGCSWFNNTCQMRSSSCLSLEVDYSRRDRNCPSPFCTMVGTHPSRCVPGCSIYTSQSDCSTFGANACAWNLATSKCNVDCGLINKDGRNSMFVLLDDGCAYVEGCERSVGNNCRVKCSDASSSPAICDDTTYFNSSGCRYYNTTSECGRDCSAYNKIAYWYAPSTTVKAEGCPTGRCNQSLINSKCYLPCSSSANATSCIARDECEWFSGSSKCDFACHFYHTTQCPSGCIINGSSCTSAIATSAQSTTSSATNSATPTSTTTTSSTTITSTTIEPTTEAASSTTSSTPTTLTLTTSTTETASPSSTPASAPSSPDPTLSSSGTVDPPSTTSPEQVSSETVTSLSSSATTSNQLPSSLTTNAPSAAPTTTVQPSTSSTSVSAPSSVAPTSTLSSSATVDPPSTTSPEQVSSETVTSSFSSTTTSNQLPSSLTTNAPSAAPTTTVQPSTSSTSVSAPSSVAPTSTLSSSATVDPPSTTSPEQVSSETVTSSFSSTTTSNQLPSSLTTNAPSTTTTEAAATTITSPPLTTTTFPPTTVVVVFTTSKSPQELTLLLSQILGIPPGLIAAQENPSSSQSVSVRFLTPNPDEQISKSLDLSKSQMESLGASSAEAALAKNAAAAAATPSSTNTNAASSSDKTSLVGGVLGAVVGVLVLVVVILVLKRQTGATDNNASSGGIRWGKDSSLMQGFDESNELVEELSSYPSPSSSAPPRADL